MLKKIIIVFISIFVFFQSSVYANSSYFNENSASSIYSNNVSSVLYIETQDSSGSGVILKEDGTFVTCFHVIANADYIMAKLEDGSIYYVNGFRYINPLSDVAILTLDTTRKFTPIAINPMNNLKIGEKVYAISNPQGLQFVFSDGMINQYTKDYIQFSAPISSGSSGGALLNRNGYLLGIITSQFNPSESQNMNFALPNEYYASKINNKKIINDSNLNWVDFVSYNVSNDEFSMITDYALSEKNTTMWYKYFRTTFLPIKNEIPIPAFPVLGYIALITGYYSDALTWYKLAYEYNYNKSIAALGISLSYFGLEGDNSKNFVLWMDKIAVEYPDIVNLILDIDSRQTNCIQQYQDEDYCYEISGLSIFEYIYKNTNFNWK